MPNSPEFLLQNLRHYLRKPKQLQQIHSLLITDGHLLHSSNPTPNTKWINTLLYNTLIRAYLNIGQPHKSILLFTHMLSHQAPPNNLTFPSLIKALCSSPSLASTIGTALHTQVVKRGVFKDPFVKTSLINLYSLLGHLNSAREVFDEMSEPCIVSCNAILDAFGKNGDMGLAISLFERMRTCDVVSWTCLINGYGRNGHFRESIRSFEKMMGCGVKPNEATFVSVLSSCASCDEGGALNQGKQIHGFMIKNEIELTVFTATALISMYGKMGSLKYAITVFNKMNSKEVCAWNAMISSLASNGKENLALDMFDRMKLKGVGPNEVTFVAVLTACARTKLVDLGLNLFHKMLDDFGIVPMMEHYGCVVDLLGRAGLLREATEFIRIMPFEPDCSVLGALLGSCKVHGAVELGNEVGRRLLELQPRHCGRYVLLSTIYAGVERWDRAAALRKAMVEAGIRKIPAFSTIDSV